MDSFFKSGLWVLLLILASLASFRFIELSFPLLGNKWYFAIGIILGVLGVFIVQEKHKNFIEDEKRNGTY